MMGPLAPCSYLHLRFADDFQIGCVIEARLTGNWVYLHAMNLTVDILPCLEFVLAFGLNKFDPVCLYLLSLL